MVCFKGDGTYLRKSPIPTLVDSVQELTGYRAELGALLGFKQIGDDTTSPQTLERC